MKSFLRDPETKETTKVLVVDDEEAIRKALSVLLSAMGFQVAVASTGSEGLDMFLKGSFDLVLTDLRMPGIDGLTLASRIKDASPSTPVVLVTGDGKEGIREKLKSNPFDSILFKPFRVEEIERAVETVLEKKLKG
jgi:CheY-like chemotaxis protein